METEIIQLFNTFYLDNPEGCNLTLGGDEGGNTPSDENIAKFRKRMDDYWKDESHRKEQAKRVSLYYNANKEQVVASIKNGWTKEARLQSGAAQKKRYTNAEERLRNREAQANYWKNASIEERENHRLRTQVATLKAFDKRNKLKCINNTYKDIGRLLGV